MRPIRASLLAATLLAVAATLAAQQPPGQPGPMPGPMPGPRAGAPPGPGQGPGQPGPDPLMASLFPPELIMQNQEALGLNDEQRNFMLGEIQRTQTQAAPVQWRLQAAMERLGNTVRQDRVDEAQVLAQLDSVLTVEREMKRLQITLLLRLKNRLTSEQRAFLRGRTAPR